MAYPTTEERELPLLSRAVRWIMALNVAVYFLQLTAIGAENMIAALGFSDARLSAGSGWWTVVTYMFVHAGFWHLALNMYTLYLFGPSLERSWGTRDFLAFYVVCGLGGWLAHLLFAKGSLLVGASAAVFGVMFAYATRWPESEFLFFGVLPVKVKWLVALLAVANLLGGIAALSSGSSGSGIAYLAHLGGLAAAWLYLRLPRGMGLDQLRQRVAAQPDLPDELPRVVPRSVQRSRGIEPPAEADEIVAQSRAALGEARRPASVEYRLEARRQELDEVLDKISRYGMDSLTPEERRLLEEMSRELRGEL
jgi:membrane associated rhomboid family serine protease